MGSRVKLLKFSPNSSSNFFSKPTPTKMRFALLFSALVVARLADGACVIDPQVPKDFRGISIFSIDGINTCRCSGADVRLGHPVCTRKQIPTTTSGAPICLRNYYQNPCQMCVCFYGRSECPNPGGLGECAYSFLS